VLLDSAEYLFDEGGVLYMLEHHYLEALAKISHAAAYLTGGGLVDSVRMHRVR
jgi:hypothetical protein